MKLLTVLCLCLLTTIRAAPADDEVPLENASDLPVPVIPELLDAPSAGEERNPPESEVAAPTVTEIPIATLPEVPPAPILAPIKPDKPWGFLPSLPQLPNIPQIPFIPSFPDKPLIPSIPQIPSIPDIPAIPSLPLKCKLWDWECIKGHFNEMLNEVTTKIKDWANKIPAQLSSMLTPKTAFFRLSGIENSRLVESNFDGPSRMYSFVAEMPLEMNPENHAGIPYLALARIKAEIPFEVVEENGVKLKFLEPTTTIERIDVPQINYLLLEPQLMTRNRAISPHYWIGKRAMEYDMESRSLAEESLQLALPRVISEMVRQLDFDVEGEPIDELQIRYKCEDQTYYE